MFTLIKTNDGSNTLKLTDVNETYHSVNGAVTEAMHIYINNGLKQLNNSSNKIKIFEMGFGTGLNAALTFLNRPKNVKIEYTAIEKHPLDDDMIKKLDYINLFNDNKSQISDIFQMDFNSRGNIGPDYSLEKIESDFIMFQTEEKFDIIYYDAFGPTVQPELWTSLITDKCYTLLNKGGLIVTYCAQGQYRRNLKSSGFVIEKLPGPPGKREITRAIKI